LSSGDAIKSPETIVVAVALWMRSQPEEAKVPRRRRTNRRRILGSYTAFDFGGLSAFDRVVSVLRFEKFQGLGNDFLIVDARSSGALMMAASAVTLCDRHRGVGADGVISLLPSRVPEAALRMHLYNADGSVAEMCGNGLRCVVRAVLGATELGARILVDTDAGLRSGEILEGGLVRVSLGRARVLKERLEVEASGHRFLGTWVSMGNPHFVIDPSGEDPRASAERFGPALERAAAFPERSNIEFYRKTQDGSLELVVFERGAGLTQACGTGAGATAFTALRRGLSDGPTITVHLPGGPLRVTAAGEEIFIEGDAAKVFEGAVQGL
jgi:diaminopimelate epimerase